MQLSDVALLGPRTAAAVAGRVRSGAIANARTAGQVIAQAVADRKELAPLVEDDSPGALTRITREDCLALLSGRSVGRLAYVAREGVPDIVPVNYAVHGGDLLLRSGTGPKLQAAERHDVVALEVDDIDHQGHVGWSVVAVGRAERLSVTDVRALPADALPATWARGPRSAVIRIRPTRLDGRRLH